MFTSRAEHRLILRHDTADTRLSPKGREAGLVDDTRWERFQQKSESLDVIRELLARRKLSADNTGVPPLPPPALLSHPGESLEHCLTDTRITLADIIPFAAELNQYPAEWLERAWLDIRYAGYIEKENRVAAKIAKMDAIKLDPAMDYAALSGLSSEAREKLKTVKPLTVGQAARVPGVRQGDIALLMVLMGKK
jgi:tRNA uridine 5-carboxymethylaminomethyl modification enzyme